MQAYIRPVHCKRTERLMSFALCRSNGPLLVDSDILDHFETDYTGKMIRETATEFHSVDDCQWGKPIQA